MPWHSVRRRRISQRAAGPGSCEPSLPNDGLARPSSFWSGRARLPWHKRPFAIWRDCVRRDFAGNGSLPARAKATHTHQDFFTDPTQGYSGDRGTELSYKSCRRSEDGTTSFCKSCTSRLRPVTSLAVSRVIDFFDTGAVVAFSSLTTVSDNVCPTRPSDPSASDCD
jgi:hypothetical protein